MLSLSLGLSLGSAKLTGPIVANQSADFGALTLAGDGGFKPTSTGGAVTSASIDSGNTGTHWQIATDGTITPTAAGDTADLASGPYSLGCTFTNSEGSDTATITITTSGNNADGRDLANSYSCSSISDIDAFVALEDATDGKICLIRAGSYGQFNIFSGAWASQWVTGVTFTAHDVSDPPHFDFESDVFPCLRLNSCENATFDNLKISKLNSVGNGVYVVDFGNSVNTVVHQCEVFGDTNPPTGFSISGFGRNSGIAAPDGITITECDIHDVVNGVQPSAVEGDVIISRNHIRRFSGDGINLNRGNSDFTGSPVTRIHQNLFSECTNPGSGHSDAIQLTTASTTMTANWSGIEIEENEFQFHDESISVQAIFCEVGDGTYGAENMQINRNFGTINTAWGIGVTYMDGGDITSNTFTYMNLSTAVTSDRPGINAPTLATLNSNNPDIYGNIAENFSSTGSVNGGPGHASNLNLGLRGATNAFTDVFNGAWSTTVGPTSRSELHTFLGMKANGPADADNSGTATIGDLGALGSGAYTPLTSIPGSDDATRNTNYETHWDTAAGQSIGLLLTLTKAA